MLKYSIRELLHQYLVSVLNLLPGKLSSNGRNYHLLLFAFFPFNFLLDSYDKSKEIKDKTIPKVISSLKSFKRSCNICSTFKNPNICKLGIEKDISSTTLKTQIRLISLIYKIYFSLQQRHLKKANHCPSTDDYIKKLWWAGHSGSRL